MKCFLFYILLTDQLSSSDCLYFAAACRPKSLLNVFRGLFFCDMLCIKNTVTTDIIYFKIVLAYMQLHLAIECEIANRNISQPTFTCLKTAMETSE